MAAITWQTQTKSEPLFPDLLWSRPERGEVAGTLLIIGGSTHGFAVVVKTMGAAQAAGIGEVKAVLPRGLEKHLGHGAQLLYVDQTATGSFSRSAISEMSGYLDWARALLLPGDLTRNAETTIFTENIIRQARVPTVVTGEALDLLLPILSNPPLKVPLIVIANFRQLQQFVRSNPLAEALLPRSTLDQRVRLLQRLIERTSCAVIVLHDAQQFLVVDATQASLTKSTLDTTEFAANAAVLAAQFPAQLFEAVTTALII